MQRGKPNGGNVGVQKDSRHGDEHEGRHGGHGGHGGRHGGHWGRHGEHGGRHGGHGGRHGGRNRGKHRGGHFLRQKSLKHSDGHFGGHGCSHNSDLINLGFNGIGINFGRHGGLSDSNGGRQGSGMHGSKHLQGFASTYLTKLSMK